MKIKIQLATTILLLFSLTNILAQSYTSQTIPMDAMTRSAVATGDYDGDGDVDLVVAGMIDTFDAATYLYENQEGEFVETGQELAPLSDGSVIFGDYDADGDLDLFLSGNGNSDPVSALYENQDGTFSEVDTEIQPMGGYTTAAFGDYDQDGDLDLVVVGDDQSFIYRNDGGSFTDIQAGITGLNYATVEWVDYDNDGDLDLTVAGEDGAMPATIFYENSNGSFIEQDIAVQDIMSGDLAWGDYDNDGDKDLAVVGYDEYLSGKTVIYRNDGNNAFKNIGVTLLGISKSSVEWGDADNDGDLDLLASGSCDDCNLLLTTVWENDGGSFSDIIPGFENVERGTARFIDYDNDGDNDVLVTGQTISGEYVTELYQQDAHDNEYHVNANPGEPASLEATPSGNEVSLSWDPGTDDYTPEGSLTYNLRVGTTPGGIDVIDPMCTTSASTLLKPAKGNTDQSRSWMLKNLPAGTYYWSVQTVDNMYHASGFAAEQSFTITATGRASVESSPVSIYPNPVVNQAKIKMSNDKFHTLEVRDITGKVLESRKIAKGKLAIDFSGYNSGIYLVRLISRTSNHVEKLLVK